jgi:adenine-specific DNA methylase
MSCVELLYDAHDRLKDLFEKMRRSASLDEFNRYLREVAEYVKSLLGDPRISAYLRHPDPDSYCTYIAAVLRRALPRLERGARDMSEVGCVLVTMEDLVTDIYRGTL